MKLYLSGPMSGIDKYNFPAFDAAAEELRAMGHEVYSPADYDRQQGFDPTAVSAEDADLEPANVGHTLSRTELMKHDCGVICDWADGVVLLDGWQRSTGARAEAALAISLSKPLYQLYAGRVRVLVVRWRLNTRLLA